MSSKTSKSIDRALVELLGSSAYEYPSNNGLSYLNV